MTNPNPTREQRQAQADDAYGTGKIDLTEWRAITNELSDPSVWTGDGKLPEPTPEPAVP